jgi:ribosomal 30S subunit maturation factor RimM
MTMSRPEWIEVGRISRAHGGHGEVRVTPDSDNPDRFTTGAVFHARPGRGGVAGLQESPAHAILIVGLADGGELMVPFVTAAVPVVDTTAGFLVIDPGFVESK